MLFCVSAFPAAADELTAHLGNIGFRGRTASPGIVDVTLKNTGKEVLTGKLKLTLVSYEPMAIVVTNDIVVAEGERPIRVLLPPLPPVMGQGTIEVRMEFVAEGRVFDLGKHELFVPDSQRRSFVIAVCDPQTTSIERRFGPVATSLSLERFSPKTIAAGSLLTLPSLVEPNAMPVQPLAYCGYDIVLLTPEGFARLESDQLDAVLAWTRAGGSVVVVTGSSANLEGKHLDFLNALVAHDAVVKPVRFLPGGKLAFGEQDSAPPAPPAPAMHLCRPELGRAAIIFGDTVSQEMRESKAWREAATWLWKLRLNLAKRVIEHGHWGFAAADDEKAPADPRERQPGAPLRNRLSAAEAFGESKDLEDMEIPERYADSAPMRDNPFLVQATYDMSSIVGTLMPDNLEVMPFGIVVLILFAFVVVIGPVDYFFLGWFRQRKLTWLTFPVMAVLFTWLMMQAANHYMGRGGRGKAMTVVDVGTRGQVLRQSRIELLFSPHEHSLRRELSGELLVPVDAARWNRQGRFYYDGSEDEVGEEPPVYEGAIAGKHTVTTRLRQWTPKLNRVTSIGRGEPALKVNWAAAREAVFDDRVSVERVREGLFGSVGGGSTGGTGGNASVVVFVRREAVAIDGNVARHFDRRGARPYRDSYDIDGEDRTVMNFPQMVYQLAVHDQRGLFEVVSQISPSAGDNFEDLSIHDAEEADTRLVFVITSEGGEIVIYRRLYRKASD